jgi:rRNA maturation protein Rpf1
MKRPNPKEIRELFSAHSRSTLPNAIVILERIKSNQHVAQLMKSQQHVVPCKLVPEQIAA